MFQKHSVSMICIEQWRGRLGGFAARLASSTWAVTARAKRRVAGVKVMTLHPLLVILAFAFFTKLIVDVPGTSQVPSPVVVQVVPGPPPLPLTPITGSVLDPGLAETLATSTARVQVLLLSGDVELNPGPGDITVLEVILHPDFEPKVRKSVVMVMEMFQAIVRKISKRDQTVFLEDVRFFTNLAQQEKKGCSWSQFCTKNAAVFSSRILVHGDGIPEPQHSLTHSLTQDSEPEVEFQLRKRHKTCNFKTLALINQGNMCFVNASLKFLSAVPELREFLVYSVPSEQVHDTIATVQEFARIYSSTKPQESALCLLHLVADRSGQRHLSSGRQEDADEFIRALLEVLGQELRENQGYQRVRALLRGQMSLQVKFKDSLPVGTCMKCKKFRPRYQEEEFLSLMLTVPITKQVLTVQNLLNNYLKDSEQNWISCPNCCRCKAKCTDVGPCKQWAVTQRTIKKAPTVVLVHLLRFAGGVNEPKVQTLVRAEPTVRLFDFMDYELEATLDHIGASLVSGHYVSKVRDGKAGGWQMHNDTAVTTIRSEAVTSRDNYFLMYRGKDGANAVATAMASTSVGPAIDKTEQVRPNKSLLY